MKKKDISRRSFLKGMGFCAASAAANTVLPGSTKLAHAASNARYLVVINLAGGFDTLALFQPDIGALAAQRPTLFRDPNNSNLILPLSGNIGLYANFNIIKSQFDQNNVALVPKNWL